MGLFNRSGRNARKTANLEPSSDARAELKAGRFSAASLLRAAGLTQNRQQVEQLEERKLLFQLTVTADVVNPATGLGTVRAFFNYATPLLQTARELPDDPPTPITRNENFNDEPYGPVGNGFFFDTSNFQVTGSGAQIAVEGQLPPGDIVDNAQRYLRLNVPTAGSFVSFRFFDEPDQNGNRPRRVGTQLTFFAGGVTQNPGNSGLPSSDATGLVPSRHRLQLLSNDQVIADFTGAALAALIDQNTPPFNLPNGVGQFVVNVPLTSPSATFDEVRIVAVNDAAPGDVSAFRLDNLSINITPPLHAPIIVDRIGSGGVVAILTGPVGASANFFDLYGRAMVRTLSLSPSVFDRNDDGMPDFNDGLGRVELNGVDSRSSFTMWPVDLTESQQPQADADFFDPGQGVSAKIVDNFDGGIDDLESAGFGFFVDITPDGQTEVVGLPDVGGRVVIGSPFVRNNAIGGGYRNGIYFPGTYNPFGRAIQGFVVDSGFTDPNQGIFVRNGQSMGSVQIFGLVFGASQFTGTVEALNFGYLLGSVSVAGDLGSIITQTDAGLMAPDPDFAFTDPTIELDPVYKTNGQLFVGRTVGEIAIGGRSLMDVTVVGDLGAPTSRPPRNAFQYSEKEYVRQIPLTAEAIAVFRQNLDQGTRQFERVSSDLVRQFGQSYLFGENFLRNDTIATAEFVGSASTGVRIVGDISARDPVNSGEDKADVYAFAVDGTGEVLIQGVGVAAGVRPYIRVVDRDGRTLAAPQGVNNTDDRRRFESTTIRFRPRDGAGVYYLVVTDEANDNGTQAVNANPYTIVMTGLASTTLGAYRTGGGAGFSSENTARGNSVTVLSGSIGSIRVGMGFGDTDGADADPTAIYNTPQDDDDSMSFVGGTYTTPGSIYNITSGGDIGTPNGNSLARIEVRIDGNLGSLHTGVNPTIAGGPNEGDLNFMFLTVGGTVGVIDVRGGIGMDQDAADPRAPLGASSGLLLRTGQRGGPGDIGTIRIGFHVAADSLRIETSPNSTIGQILVSQDSYTDGDTRSGLYSGQRGMPITMGPGSDVRFVDLPEIDLQNVDNQFFTLTGEEEREFVDDSGVRFSIRMVGAQAGNFVNVRVLPINLAQGVVVAQIEANLVGGTTLEITPLTGTNDNVISIGRMIVTGGAEGAGSNIRIGGGTNKPQIDIYRIDGTGFFNVISNESIRGDFVTVDVEALNTLTVRGNLGSTQMPLAGQKSLAARVGLQAGLGDAVGGAVGWVAQDSVIDNDFAGDVYRPLNFDEHDGGEAFLDDLGSPFDDIANGLIVRTGDVQLVSVDGTVGDVILQQGSLVNLVVNADRVTAIGGFDGITGAVFALNIDTVDVGDGIRVDDPDSVIGTAGIFALNNLRSVTTSVRNRTVTIGGVIASSNTVVFPNDPFLLPDQVDGIESIDLRNARFDGAVITVSRLEEYWTSFFYTEEVFTPGDLGTLSLNGTTLFKTRTLSRNVGDINITGGTYDATTVEASGRIGRINADNFLNSTLTGDTVEFIPNQIIAGGDVEELRATQDISDLTVDVIGDIRQGVSSRNLIRGTLSVANTIERLQTTQDVRNAVITSGQLRTFTIGGNMVGATVNVSGSISNITAADSIRNSRINVTGPSGNIDSIQAVNLISGSISSTGVIRSVRVTTGDLTADISTSGSANVDQLFAGRDALLTTDIGGSLNSLQVGRHIGSRSKVGTILVRGDVGSVTAPNGQLYYDLRSGGTIGSVSLGREVAKPGNDRVGRGSIVAMNRISSVTTAGDFGGDIISYTGGISNITINNGSLYSGRTIAAYDGNIENLTINGGSNFASIHADGDIVNLRVNGGTGPFGDMGIDPDKNQFNTVAGDNFRNQLPVDLGAQPSIQGPLISAGRDIRTISISGSVYETGFYAGRNIETITIGGRVANDQASAGRKGSFFAAGDRIGTVTVGASIADTTILAGALSLGADNRPGGTGLNADTIQAGSIGTVSSNTGAFGVTIFAGVEAGANGVYGDDRLTAGDESLDDGLALGISTIDVLNLRGTLNNVQVAGDVLSTSIRNDSRLADSSQNNARRETLPLARYVLDSGSGTPGVSFTGVRTFGAITLTFSGPGSAFFDSGANLVTLRNTTSASSLTASSSTGTLNNFRVVTNDDASLGTLTVSSTLSGDSQMLVDGGIGRVVVAGSVFGRDSLGVIDALLTPRIITGGDIANVEWTNWNGALLLARNISSVRVTGDFGGSEELGDATIRALSMGGVQITGVNRGFLSSERDIGAISVTGTSSRAVVRAGGSIASITSGAMSQTVISAYDSIGQVTVNGEMFDSAITAGLDLGADGAFDGEGADADRISTGFISNVNINGNFRESDITAGLHRGQDKFFGTVDDRVAAGRSSIGNVTIQGTRVGSNRASETYRIASSGTLGQVRVGGQQVSGITSGSNFGVETITLAPEAVTVTSITVNVDALTYEARVRFNQPMDFSSLRQSFSVSEVRGLGDVEIRLIEGVDYTLSYDRGNINDQRDDALVVRFARAVTSGNLPQVAGRPGPGVYRFRLDQTLTQSRVTRLQLDGDSNGRIETNDTFSADVIIGDAGDKLVAERITLGNGQIADLYEPLNLDFVLDNNRTPDGLPDPNRPVVINGAIGDHPDNDASFFRFGGDVDLYKITLLEGQIITFSALIGAAFNAPVALLAANGQNLVFLGGDNRALSLPTAPLSLDAPLDQTPAASYLIRETGTYYIAVGNTAQITTPGVINNVDAAFEGAIGSYTLNFIVFDDGDTGFTSQTTSGDGTNLVSPPAQSAFAGVDGVLGTSDDLPSITVGEFVFTRASNGTVSGTNERGIVVSRTAAGRETVTIDSAIGLDSVAGASSAITADADVYHLNNRNPITPGTKMRATVRLSELGSDLGSQAVLSSASNRGTVQFGLFDTSNSTRVDDATLVFSPSDFLPFGGKPNTTIADNGTTKYGYNEKGDFYIEFIVPERLGAPGQAGTFAMYIQGVINSPYQMEIITDGTGTITRRTQNFFIETGGGSIDWFEAGGRTTQLSPFDINQLGFTGTIANGQPVGDYVLSTLVSNLNSLFQGAGGTGFDVRFSTNPADFEFQPFSTIYLTGAADPVSQIFRSFTSFRFQDIFSGAGIRTLFSSTNPYGASQHSDPFNADLNDDGVVFVPPFAVLGYSPSRSDIDQFTKSITGAIARRAGELMGLRMTTNNVTGTGAVTTFDPMAADAVLSTPSPAFTYSISDTNRTLSDGFDSIESTDFFLGRQRAFSLLDQIVRRRS